MSSNVLSKFGQWRQTLNDSFLSTIVQGNKALIRAARQLEHVGHVRDVLTVMLVQ